MSGHKEVGYYLKTYLDILKPWLVDSDTISEITVNKAGEIWIECTEKGLHSLCRPEIDEEFLENFARQVAAYNDQSISEESPLLSASLPNGERIQFVRPPASPNGHCFSIRKQTLLRMTIDDYDQRGAFSGTQTHNSGALTPEVEELRELHAKGNIKEFLIKAVAAEQNIIISGGTSTGKTTFLNALLLEIKDDTRLITIEDTREVEITQPNHLNLVAAKDAQGVARVTIQQLLEACLRLRPDRLIMGELRGAEAFTFLRASQSGHPGSITTVHADTPEGAIDQLSLMVLQANLGMTRNDIKTYVESMVDIIVQLERNNEGLRFVSAIKFKHEKPV